MEIIIVWFRRSMRGRSCDIVRSERRTFENVYQAALHAEHIIDGALGGAGNGNATQYLMFSQDDRGEIIGVSLPEK
ncbi:MAG: hypothetical protein JW885_02525 [Deltaproteobacteria bacterium]|nr:hypothetical protein [Candidatus Zymogenaceae bacterium]